MEPQMPGLAACHGKILSPQNAINGTPRHHPYIHPLLSNVYYKTDKDARPKTEHMWNLGEDKEGKTPKLGQVQNYVQTTSFPNGCFYAPISRVIRGGVTHLMKSIMDRVCSIHQSRQSLDE